MDKKREIRLSLSKERVQQLNPSGGSNTTTPEALAAGCTMGKCSCASSIHCGCDVPTIDIPSPNDGWCTLGIYQPLGGGDDNNMEPKDPDIMNKSI